MSLDINFFQKFINDIQGQFSLIDPPWVTSFATYRDEYNQLSIKLASLTGPQRPADLDTLQKQTMELHHKVLVFLGVSKMYLYGRVYFGAIENICLTFRDEIHKELTRARAVDATLAQTTGDITALRQEIAATTSSGENSVPTIVNNLRQLKIKFDTSNQENTALRQEIATTTGVQNNDIGYLQILKHLHDFKKEVEEEISRLKGVNERRDEREKNLIGVHNNMQLALVACLAAIQNDVAQGDVCDRNRVKQSVAVAIETLGVYRQHPVLDAEPNSSQYSRK